MFKEFRDSCGATLETTLAKHKIKVEADFSIPQVEAHGELSTNVCFQLASTFRKSPEEVASLLVSDIKPQGLIKEVKSETGYLNFYIDYPSFTEELLKKVNITYGAGENKERIILEHTSANPDGPLHIGHLRNAVIGDTLARILKFAGHPTEVHYYLNDMGKQTAKVVWGRRHFKIREGKKDHATAEIYIKANKSIEEENRENEVSEILSLYEGGDEKVTSEFESAVEFCLEGIKESLQRLGIKHDKFVWESTFVKDGAVDEIIKNLSSQDSARMEDGALIVDLGKFGIEKDMVITRGDGTSLYTTRDIAHHIWKSDRGSAINIWGADHKLVSEQLKAGLKMMGFEAPEFIIHEFISLPEGSMSTRMGVFVSADQLIEETVKQANKEVRLRRPDIADDKVRTIAEEIGVSAVRFNISRIAPEKSMVFKWDEALDFERQGAPFIQYAYARGRKILEKGSLKGKLISCQPNQSEKNLIKTISRFPEIVEEAANSRKASTMANYATELASRFQVFYMSSRVLGSKEEQFRLSLVNASLVVLKKVMELLGIKVIEEM
jgi:arginyl-tRNA synthetase